MTQGSVDNNHAIAQNSTAISTRRNYSAPVRLALVSRTETFQLEFRHCLSPQNPDQTAIECMTHIRVFWANLGRPYI